ncbi:MAG TPA: TolC family protein [Candidatus Polarisedimenticolaceae bacterium]|nr:TolC family protein [Candidatus Polarisedimenticolaceae bacterium]
MRADRERRETMCGRSGTTAARALAVLVGPALLAGCLKVGPDYAPEDLTDRYRDGFRTGATAGETTSLATSAPVGEWWRQFEDPELERLVQALVGGNLDLAAARERIVEARARRGIVRADRLPHVDLEGQAQAAGTGEEALNFVGPPPGEEAEIYAAGALAGWEIDLWGRVGRLVEAADREIEARVADYGDVVVSLAAELALAYVDARTLEQRIDMLDRNVELLESSLEIVESRHRAGIGTELDVRQSRRVLERTRAERPPLLRAREVAYNRIAVLIGEPPVDGVITAGELPRPPGLVGIGIPADLLARRADVRRADRDYAAAVARVGSTMAERYPRLSLFGSLKFQTDDAGALLDPEAMVFSIGPTLRWPLFAGGQISSNVRVRESQAEQARLLLERTVLEAVREVDDAAVGVAQNQRRVLRLRQAAADARHSVALSEQLYKAGLGSLLQLIDAQRALVAVEDELLVARQDELGGIVRLYRTLGGGWESLPPAVATGGAER